MNKKEIEEKQRWEEELILSLIKLGRKYNADFFSSMLIKVLWSLEDD